MVNKKNKKEERIVAEEKERLADEEQEALEKEVENNENKSEDNNKGLEELVTNIPIEEIISEGAGDNPLKYIPREIGDMGMKYSPTAYEELKSGYNPLMARREETQDQDDRRDELASRKGFMTGIEQSEKEEEKKWYQPRRKL